MGLLRGLNEINLVKYLAQYLACSKSSKHVS